MEQKIFGVIYKITNLVNGKVYVGQTIDMNRRLKQHTNQRKTKSLIDSAIYKHRLENFVFDVIFCVFDRKSLDLAEKHFIKEYKSKDLKFGYNLTEGGNGASGYLHTKEAKIKIMSARKLQIYSKESKEKMSNSHKGKRLSEETIRKLSELHKGKSRSEESRQNMSDAASKRTVIQLSPEGLVIAVFSSLKEAGESTGANMGCICMCARGKRKSAGGFLWRYPTSLDTTAGDH